MRVRDGRIVEVAPGLAPDGERVVDAGGAFVIPGIIDTHTHVDGAMWWNPDLDPLPAYGNTTAVFGYCGNSIAPLAGAQRDEIVDLLCFLEDLPLEAFEREVPWTWERWPEYATAHRRAADERATSAATSVTSRCAPTSWATPRGSAPRPTTRSQRMCALLDEALRHGALGLSVNHFDKDRQLRLVPGFFADRRRVRPRCSRCSRATPAARSR